MKKRLRIAINARIPEGSGAGGIETVLRILTLLNRFGDDEEYVFIIHSSDPDWIKPLLGKRQTTVRAPHPAQFESNNKKYLKRILGSLVPLARNLKNFVKPPVPTGFIPTSAGFYESLNCDVIHFPYQDYVYCRIPTVYNPHDLQHLHYPEFFTPEECQRRESLYPAACRAANIVVTASEFVKQDIVQKYKIETDKVQVISWGFPEIELKKYSEEDIEKTFEKYQCSPRPFVLYPAMTWRHKNHIRLLEAAARLRDREGLKINIICTGHKTSFYWQIERRIHELNLEEQIRFIGLVEYKELSLFYHLAQFVIVPTLFEAASGPVFEAWQHNTAVACSSVTSLPEQTADAALLFNPFSVEEIADALKKMTIDARLREQLRARGMKRLKDFSLEKMAKAYLSVYKKAAGLSLNDDESILLAGANVMSRNLQ